MQVYSVNFELLCCSTTWVENHLALNFCLCALICNITICNITIDIFICDRTNCTYCRYAKHCTANALLRLSDAGSGRSPSYWTRTETLLSFSFYSYCTALLPFSDSPNTIPYPCFVAGGNQRCRVDATWLWIFTEFPCPTIQLACTFLYAWNSTAAVESTSPWIMVEAAPPPCGARRASWPTARLGYLFRILH